MGHSQNNKLGGSANSCNNDLFLAIRKPRIRLIHPPKNRLKHLQPPCKEGMVARPEPLIGMHEGQTKPGPDPSRLVERRRQQWLADRERQHGLAASSLDGGDEVHELHRRDAGYPCLGLLPHPGEQARAAGGPFLEEYPEVGGNRQFKGRDFNPGPFTGPAVAFDRLHDLVIGHAAKRLGLHLGCTR
jgi:hypothetical protein